MRRIIAGAVALASTAALAVAAVGLAPGREAGVSDRVVAAFGTVPVPAPAAAAPAQGPNVAGADLAPLPRVPAIRAAPPAVEVRSGLIGELPAERRAVPVRLMIPDIGVAAPVAGVGYDARRSEMEVPRSPGEVGWYRFGASPGEMGSAVLAAHVDFKGAAGAFYDLHELGAGTTVVVVMGDGSRQRWEVVARRQYGKELLPTDAIFARDGKPMLALVTCGGPFDGRRYEDNVVVFARPAGAAAGDPGPA